LSFSLFLLQVIFWVIIGFGLLTYTRQYIPSRFFLPLLGYKVIFGWLLGWLYLDYYEGGDTFVYYQNALVLSNLFAEDPIAYINVIIGNERLANLTLGEQPRALFFAKAASLLSICSLGNYWIIALSLSMISFFASWWFVARLKALFGLHLYQVLIPFLVYPSFVFWSSGLLKESLALALICTLGGLALGFYTKGFSSPRKALFILLMMAISAFMLWKLKYYYAAVLLPMLLLMMIWKLVSSLVIIKRQAALLPGLGIVFAVLILIVMQLHPNLNPDYLLEAIMLNHELTVAASLKGGYVSFPGLEADWLSFIAYYPRAVYNGLFAPFPFLQGFSFLHLLAGIENLVVLVLSSLAIISLFFQRNQNLRHYGVVVLCVLYIVILAGLITMASPNYGSLIRYRVAYAPFWLMLVLLALDKNLILNFWRSRKKT